MKYLDAVKLMRDLRDKLSAEVEHMTPQERMQYIREKAQATGLGSNVSNSKGKKRENHD